MGNQTSKSVDASQVEIGGNSGSGFFGNVRWAKVEGHGRLALKTAKRQQEEEWLRNEALVQAEGKHERVVEVFGCQTVGGEWTLIMEHIPGPCLEQLLLRTKQRLAFALRVQMCCDVAEGLRHLHNLPNGRCIIHNDLTPSNILITSHMRCKIADFGCSRLYEESGEFVEGCPADLFPLRYAPPEKLAARLLALRQPEGSEYEDFYTYDRDDAAEIHIPSPHPSSDIYSFAFLVHMLLYRILPWGDMPLADVITNVLQGNRPADRNNVSASLEELPHARFLWRIMIKCWHQESSARPTAAELCEMFGFWLSCHGLADCEETQSSETEYIKY